MPVNRCIHLQIVGDIDLDIVAFLEPDKWGRHRAIDAYRVSCTPVYGHGKAVDIQIEFGSVQRWNTHIAPMAGHGPGRQIAGKTDEGACTNG